MPGHSRSKNGVASLAYVPGIHVLQLPKKDVDGRDEPGHDAVGYATVCAAESRGSAMRSENSAPISRPRRQTTLQERREYGPSDITRMNSCGTSKFSACSRTPSSDMLMIRQSPDGPPASLWM